MSSRYEKEVSNYHKKDAIIALCFFVFSGIVSYLNGTIVRLFDTSLQVSQMLGMSVSLLKVAIIFAIVLISKQGISSLGFHKQNLWFALRLGFFFALIPLILNNGILTGLINGWELNEFGLMMYLLLYIFILAGHEDILFVGYIQTRLYGLVKDDKLAVNIGAGLFALAHIPYGLAINGIGFLNMTLILWLIATFFLHRAFVQIFKRYFSLFTVTIVHVAINWTGAALWRQAYENWTIVSIWPVISTIVLVWAIDIWFTRVSKVPE